MSVPWWAIAQGSMGAGQAAKKAAKPRITDIGHGYMAYSQPNAAKAIGPAIWGFTGGFGQGMMGGGGQQEEEKPSMDAELSKYYGSQDMPDAPTGQARTPSTISQGQPGGGGAANDEQLLQLLSALLRKK